MYACTRGGGGRGRVQEGVRECRLSLESSRRHAGRAGWPQSGRSLPGRCGYARCAKRGRWPLGGRAPSPRSGASLRALVPVRLVMVYSYQGGIPVRGGVECELVRLVAAARRWA